MYKVGYQCYYDSRSLPCTPADIFPVPSQTRDCDFVSHPAGFQKKCLYYGGAKHPQTKSIAPSVKDLANGALWFVLWRSVYTV